MSPHRQIRLPVLATTDPSLAESMRGCMLRAGLSRAPAVKPFVLGNPKAWLGTAYHEVLARLATSADSGWEALWEEAVERQRSRAASHPLDSRFGQPSSWPGFYFMRETLRLRAAELVHARAMRPPVCAAPAQARPHRESRFVACGEKLTGRPDLVLSKKIVDYKTGSVTEEDDAGQQHVAAAYARQLRVYSYLVHEALGWWPDRAELVPMNGPAVLVDIDPRSCAIEAEEAVRLLGHYEQLRAEGNPWKLASPSAAACRWCPFKLMCDPFWSTASTEWAGLLDGEVLQGQLESAPRPLYGGLAFAFRMQVAAGTVSGTATIAPVRQSDSGFVHQPPPVSVRVVSLRFRPDGSLTPTQRTLYLPQGAVPQVVT